MILLSDVTIARFKSLLLVVGDIDEIMDCNASYLQNLAHYIDDLQVPVIDDSAAESKAI